MAASMQWRGHKLISDDSLPIYFEGDEILTLPGYPQIKLFADSVEAVGGNTAELERVHRNFDKFSFPSQNGLSKAKISVSAIYVLNIDDRIDIRRLTMPEAFIAATTHTHINYYLKESNGREQHFQQCQKLVQSIPFFQLSRPHNFAQMHAVTEALEGHLDQLKTR